MPNTDDYQKRLILAKKRTLTEQRRPRPLLEMHHGECCPKCGESPCCCEEEHDDLEEAIQREALDVVEIIAATDPHSFAFLAECNGLTVAAFREHDPLNKEILAEDVASLAKMIHEDPNECGDNLDVYQTEFREIGAKYGFCVQS